MFFQKQIKKKAVAYYRHSAEDKQENSVAIQRIHAQKFADANDIEIIHEEADEGKSGLDANRPGFDRLFREFILNPDSPLFAIYGKVNPQLLSYQSAIYSLLP